MIRQYRIIYIALLVALLTQAIALEVVTRMNGPLLDLSGAELSAGTAYAVDYALLILSLAGTFFGIRCKQLNPVLRMSFITIPATFDLIYYYFNYDVNVLWCLPVLCVAYIFVWPKD